MRRLLVLLVAPLVAAVAPAACRDSVESAPVAVEFEWSVGSLDDGVGRLVAEGFVGPSGARYSLHATPAVTDGSGYADLMPGILGASVNGFDEHDEIDPEGRTEVIVLEDGTRYYRLPWLLDEGSEGMQGAEWIRVEPAQYDPNDPPGVDIVSFTMGERFDEAVTLLVAAASFGRDVRAPELDWEGGPGTTDDNPYAPAYDAWRGIGGGTLEEGEHYEVSQAGGEARWSGAGRGPIPGTGAVTWTAAPDREIEPPAESTVISVTDLERNFPD